MFAVAPSTPASADWLCPQCSANEATATRLAVALRLSLRRGEFERALADCPRVPRDLRRACKAVLDELAELVEQLRQSD